MPGGELVTMQVKDLETVPSGLNDVIVKIEISIHDANGTPLHPTSATIRFGLTAAQLGTADPNTVLLAHYTGTAWEYLPTTLISVGPPTWVFEATSSSLSPFAVIIDTIAPVVELRVDADKVEGTWSDVGKGVNITSLVLTLDGQPLAATTSATGFNSILPADLAEGEHELVATLKDFAGNAVTTRITVHVEPPTPTPPPPTPTPATPTPTPEEPIEKTSVPDESTPEPAQKGWFSRTVPGFDAIALLGAVFAVAALMGVRRKR